MAEVKWTTRRDSVWGKVHVLRAGRKAILSLWHVPPARMREFGWRVGLEAYPPNRDHHEWLHGRRMTVDEAKRAAVIMLIGLCRAMECDCASVRKLAERALQGGAL